MPNGATAGPVSVRSIVARSLRELPSHTRRTVWIVILIWVIVVALQFWDSRDRPGARGYAEFISVLTGTLGFLLVGLVQLLRAAASSATHDAGPVPLAVRQILMSLPLVASLAAVLLSATIAMLVARVWLGTSTVMLAVAVVYTFVAGLALQLAHGAAVRLYEFGQAEASRVARIEAELSTARLAALQAQMHPHFLFNALNTIAALARTDAAAAEATVEQLSDTLRLAIDRGDNPLTTLDEELRFVRAYLGVEARRFGDRLMVEWRVSPGVDGLKVPAYSLQPLVENAIKHGIGVRAAGGRILVSVSRESDGCLKMSVEDNGDGFEPRVREGTGIGNLRRRLTALYGHAASLAIEHPPSGARVTVRVPAETVGL